MGKQFIARTDHIALRWIKNFKQPKGQVALWIKRLSIFDFVVEQWPGRKHGNADGMSRIPLKDTGVVENNVCTVRRKLPKCSTFLQRTGQLLGVNVGGTTK